MESLPAHKELLSPDWEGERAKQISTWPAANKNRATLPRTQRLAFRSRQVHLGLDEDQEIKRGLPVPSLPCSAELKLPHLAGRGKRFSQKETSCHRDRPQPPKSVSLFLSMTVKCDNIFEREKGNKTEKEVIWEGKIN